MLPFSDIPAQSLILIIDRRKLFVLVRFLFGCLVGLPLRGSLDGMIFREAQLRKPVLSPRRAASSSRKLLLVQGPVLRRRHRLAVLRQRARPVDLLHWNKVRIQFPEKLPCGSVFHEVGIRRRPERVQGLDALREGKTCCLCRLLR